MLNALARALHGALSLLALRRPARSAFAPSPTLFTLLIGLDLLLTILFSLAAFGPPGEINAYEVPRALLYVPLVLAVGLLAQHTDRDANLLVLPVAFAAASVLMTVITSVLYILAQHQLVPFAETYWFVFDDVVLVWSAAIIVVAVMRLVDATFAARLWLGLAAVALIVLPTLWLPQGMLWIPRGYDANAYAASFHSLAEERAFYAQQGALEQELAALEAERPGIVDVYVVAAALYAGEDVFMKDVDMVARVLRERFDASGRTVMLVNNAKTLEEHPIATLTSVKRSLARVGEIMNPDEDVLVLYLTSHGSDKHELAVDFRPLRLLPIGPEQLKSALDASRVRFRVIVVSACYSGAFVDALKNERTLIVTAASADRTSFGCGNASDSTYLARAYFGEALRETRSFENAFGRARKTIEQWEREKGYTPSEPQIFVGSAIRPKLAQIEQRLSSASARAH